MFKYYKNKQNGFTLLELVVVIGILSFVVFMVFRLESDIFVLNGLSQSSLNSHFQGQNVMRTIIPELRKSASSNLGAFPIVSVATSSITFFSDVDDDPIIEQVRYYKQGSTIMKGVINPVGSPLVYNPASEVVSVLATDIANSTSTPIFEYYDTNYDGTSAPLSTPIDLLSIRLIKVTVVIDNNSNKLPAPLTFTSQVTLRNLKDNS
ncbi:MAG: prepilin-type N-terminal cleavage/methylation domain-containing protein [Patescibacteria group bacterium]